MEIVAVYAIALIAALYCLAFAFFVMVRSLIGKEAPFIRSPWMAVNLLENFYTLDKDSVFYDLGCGDGRIMRAFYLRYPKAKYVGVEKNALPRIAFEITNGDIHGPNFTLLKGDIFKTDLSKATHIFAYLVPSQLQELSVKLEAELRKGAKIATLDAEIKTWTPKEVVKFFDKKGVERLIFFYEM